MSKQVRIIRATKDRDNPYKQLRRASFDGSGLSFEARGVLAYVLMKPDDWELQITDVMREGNIGRDKAYRILDELIRAGYAERLDGRDEDGKFGHNFIVIHEQPCTENPDTVKPDTEEPYPENPDHTNKGIPLKREKKLKKEVSDACASKPAHHPLVQAYRDFYQQYPSKAQMRLIMESDPPIAEWVRAMRAWSGRGYKPTNIAGMLEWALNPQLMVRQPGGGHYMNKGERQNAAVEEAFAMLRERVIFDES
jgi:hypothetical protein